jgi:hypothetical protein
VGWTTVGQLESLCVIWPLIALPYGKPPIAPMRRFSYRRSTMPADFLSQLARQVKIDKSPACRRAIQRILSLVKVKFESGVYASQTEAEADFRKLAEQACARASGTAAPGG